MFLILILLTGLGLMSIMTGIIVSSFYSIGLFVVVGMIRNSEQEISRENLRRVLLVLILDHFTTAVVAITLSILMVTVLWARTLFPLIDGLSADNEALIISMALILAFLALVITAVGVLLLLIEKSLKARGSVQRELDWEPWLTVLNVTACVLQLPSCFVLFVFCAPFLWQLNRLARISRQGNLIWTIAVAVGRGLPLAPEVRVHSLGLWGQHRWRLELLCENLDSGQSLSNSLERQPGLVPHSVVMRIRLGEETGTLAEVLEDCVPALIRSQSKEESVVSTQHAFMVLLLPLMFLPLVLGFISYYIVPKHKKIFEDFGVQLPELTRGMFEFLNSSSSAVFGMACFVGVMLIIRFVLRDWERDWPLLSWLAPRANAPPILRSLALLVRENRPLTTGLKALECSHGRPSVRKQLSRVLTNIDQGLDAWDALAKQRLIGPRDLLLLRAAERVRNLPWALEQIAETIERRYWNWLRIIIEIGSPIATVVIALLVLAVCVAFFLPLVVLIDMLS